MKNYELLKNEKGHVPELPNGEKKQSHVLLPCGCESAAIGMLR